MSAHYSEEKGALELRNALNSDDVERLKQLIQRDHVNMYYGNGNIMKQAIENGFYNMVAALIEVGFDVNTDTMYETPLDIAVRKRNAHIVRLLIDSGANVNPDYDYDDEIIITPLYGVLVMREHDIAVMLLEAGANFSRWSEADMMEQLENVIASGLGKVLEYFMDSSSKIHADVTHNPTKYFHRLLIRGRQNSGIGDVAWRLIRLGADIFSEWEGNSLLKVAVGNKLVDVVRVLLAAGWRDKVRESPSKEFTDRAISGYEEYKSQASLAIFFILLDAGANADNHIHTFVQQGDVTLLQRYLAYRPNVDYRNAKGETALFVASKLGRADMLMPLLEAGAAVAIPDNEGMTPILIAYKEGHMDVVNILLPYDPISRGRMLRAAFDKNDVHTFTEVLRDYHFVVDDAFFKATIDTGRTEMAEAIIQRGRDPNTPFFDGSLPLERAIKAKNVNMVRMLLDIGADAHHRFPSGRTYIYGAIGTQRS